MKILPSLPIKTSGFEMTSISIDEAANNPTLDCMIEMYHKLKTQPPQRPVMYLSPTIFNWWEEYSKLEEEWRKLPEWRANVQRLKFNIKHRKIAKPKSALPN